MFTRNIDDDDKGCNGRLHKMMARRGMRGYQNRREGTGGEERGEMG